MAEDLVDVQPWASWFVSKYRIELIMGRKMEYPCRIELRFGTEEFVSGIFGGWNMPN